MAVRGQGRSEPIGRLVRLDGLRGVLAVYVMLGHTVPFIPLPVPVGRIAEEVVSHGLAAVDIFFALSGLVIVQSISRFEGRTGAFLAARGRRLLPTYFAVLAGSTLLFAAGSPFPLMPWLHAGDAASQIWPAGPPPHLCTELAVHLALLQGALPHGWLPDASFALLGPAWSLSTEWQFYAVIALLMVWFRNDDAGLIRLISLFLGLAIAARLYAVLVPDAWRFGRAFLPDQAAYFALGIAAARFWRGGSAGPLFATTLLITMAIGASTGAGWGMAGKALPPLVWALAIAVQRTPEHRWLRPAARVLSHPITLWLGLVSYPLYLVNEPVGRALALLIGPHTIGRPTSFGLLWAIATLSSSIAIAAALHYGIERRFIRRRPAVTPDAVPAAAAL